MTQENLRLKKEVANMKEESRKVLVDKQQMAREQVSAFFLVSGQDGERLTVKMGKREK